MNHEAAYQGKQNLGMRGIGMDVGSANAIPTRTIAARLESTAYALMAQCSRIEDVLAKINGTPRAGHTPGATPEKIATTVPMAQSVETLEQQANRLCELANNLEQVA